jgi:outer membrane autotransporter protein
VSGDATAGTNQTTSRVFGFATGLDYRLTPSTTVGFALAGGGTSWGLSEGLGGGSSDFFQAGVFGSHRFGTAYVSAALAYGWHQTSTSRTVTAGGFETLAADFTARSFGARLEGGYRFATPWAGITPYGAVQAQVFRTPSYSERATVGPGAFALAFDAQSTSSTRTELGVWLDNPIVLPAGALLTLRSRAAWAHDFNNEGRVSATFQTLPGSNFTVNGAAPAKDGALVTAAAEYRANQRWSMLAKFDGEFSRTTNIYGGTGTVRYAW